MYETEVFRAVKLGMILLHDSYVSGHWLIYAGNPIRRQSEKHADHISLDEKIHPLIQIRPAQ